MADEKFVELSDADFAVLFPSEQFKIGKTMLTIKPMDVSRLNVLIASIRADWGSLQDDLADQGLTLETVEHNMMGLVQVLMHRVPMVLALMSGLHPDHVQKLPIEVALNLFRKCIQMNLRDQSFFGLLSAVRDMAGEFQAMMAGKELTKGSRKLQPNSSRKGTAGQKFSRTRGVR